MDSIISSAHFDDILEYVVLGVIVLVAAFFTWLQKRRAAQVFIAGPILMATYANGSMQKMSEGRFGEMPYSFMISGVDLSGHGSSEDEGGLRNYTSTYEFEHADDDAARALARQSAQNNPHVLMLIELPAPSQVHIAALGMQAAASAIDPTVLIGNHLVPVELEGDFPKDFKLYCDEPHQVELRQVLDPATMAFLADYCKEYSWEIYSSYLYIIESEQSKRSDDTNMVEDAEALFERVKPVMERFARHPEPNGTK